MSRPRDVQKTRVYDAEHFSAKSALAVRLLGPGGKKYSTGTVHIDACQAYVDAIVSRKWFIARWGAGWQIAVVQKSGGKAYGGNRGYRRGRMTLPVFARNEQIILHELAHCLTNGDWRIAHHGPEWAGVYLELVRYAVGKQAAAQVRAQFNTKGRRVRWNRDKIGQGSGRISMAAKSRA